MHKGLRLWVTCADLGLPAEHWNKEDSYQAANEWWERKRTELADSRRQLHPHAERLAELETRRQYATRHGLPDADVIDAEIIRVEKLPAADPDASPDFDPFTAKRIEGLVAIGVELPTDPSVLRTLVSDDAVWADRLKREAKTPRERTLGALAARWVADRQDEARNGIRSHESADALRRCLGKFVGLMGEAAPVEAITYETWHRWYVHCAGMVAKRDDDEQGEGWSADTAQKIFTVSRTFVKWLWETDVLTSPPKNLASKQHKFERPAKIIPLFTNEEIRTLVEGAKDLHRLIILLMLNCGMTQKDVADLRKIQVDLTAGTITRRRSKMAKKKSGRMVRYKLWSEVVELLKTHMNTIPNEPRALVTKSGKPWVWTETTPTGKMRKSDNVATVFNAIKRRVGMKAEGKSLKVFRKTSATRLRSNPTFQDLRFWFLGHSEKAMSDRHYSPPSQEQLDAAIDWLRTQY